MKRESNWMPGKLCPKCHGELEDRTIKHYYSSMRKCPHCGNSTQKTYGVLDHYLCPYKIVDTKDIPWWKFWEDRKTIKIWATVNPGTSPDFRNLYRKLLEQYPQEELKGLREE